VISIAGADCPAMRHPIAAPVLVPNLCLERDLTQNRLSVLPVRPQLSGFLSSCAHPRIEIKRYFCNID
jgi:hypothetical protein